MQISRKTGHFVTTVFGGTPYGPQIKEIRIMGGCVCIEVHDGACLKGFPEFAYERGVFNRPFLNFLYAMVPYIITEDELRHVLRTMKDWFLR